MEREVAVRKTSCHKRRNKGGEGRVGLGILIRGLNLVDFSTGRVMMLCIMGYGYMNQ